jgi:hypothetical protein
LKKKLEKKKDFLFTSDPLLGLGDKETAAGTEVAGRGDAVGATEFLVGVATKRPFPLQYVETNWSSEIITC